MLSYIHGSIQRTRGSFPSHEGGDSGDVVSGKRVIFRLFSDLQQRLIQAIGIRLSIADLGNEKAPIVLGISNGGSRTTERWTCNW